MGVMQRPSIVGGLLTPDTSSPPGAVQRFSTPGAAGAGGLEFSLTVENGVFMLPRARLKGMFRTRGATGPASFLGGI